MRGALVIAALWSLSFLVAPARGQEAPRSEETSGAARAIELGEQALEAWGRKRYTLAYELFQRADRAAHSPVFVLYMARCQRGLGRLLSAKAHYLSVRDEALPADAPAPWREAQAEAARELGELRAALVSLRVETSALGAGERLTVDGDDVRPGETVEVDPGAHVVALRRGRSVVLEKRISVAEGEGLVVVELKAPPVVAVPAPGAEAAPGGPDRAGTFVPGALLLGLAGASAIAGAVTGGLALSRGAEVKDQCEGTNCARADTSLRDEALALAHASTASFAVAGAAGLAGALLLVFRPGSGEASARVVPTIAPLGPAGLHLFGRF